MVGKQESEDASFPFNTVSICVTTFILFLLLLLFCDLLLLIAGFKSTGQRWQENPAQPQADAAEGGKAEAGEGGSSP